MKFSADELNELDKLISAAKKADRLFFEALDIIGSMAYDSPDERCLYCKRRVWNHTKKCILAKFLGKGLKCSDYFHDLLQRKDWKKTISRNLNQPVSIGS